MPNDGPAPPRRFVKHNWGAVAESARRTPGQWRRVAAGIPRSHVRPIKRGKYRAFRVDANDPQSGVPFEVCTRDGSGSHADLWIMYTPQWVWKVGEDGRLQHVAVDDGE